MSAQPVANATDFAPGELVAYPRALRSGDIRQYRFGTVMLVGTEAIIVEPLFDRLAALGTYAREYVFKSWEPVRLGGKRPDSALRQLLTLYPELIETAPLPTVLEVVVALESLDA